MSAWVVSKHHIDVLVSAAIEFNLTVRLDDLALQVPGPMEIARETGAMLWAENVRSVVFRNQLSGTDEDSGDAISVYPLPPLPRAAPLACFDYQAFECPDYEGTTAALFDRQLRMAVGEDYPDSECWGFDSEQHVKHVKEACAIMAGAP